MPAFMGRPDNPNVYDTNVKSAGVYSDYAPSFNDDSSPCYQCRSIFTIEKGLFYTFSIMHLFEYIEGFKFLKLDHKFLNYFFITQKISLVFN